MRHVPPRAWLIAAFALAAGCHHTDPPADGMPGQTPASFRLREAPDATDLVILPPPPPRKVVQVQRPPLPATPQPDNPTHSAAAIHWHAEAAADAPAQLGAPRALAPRRVAVSDGAVYAHALDHRWLVGALVYEASQRRWSVRYANPGEPDPYDGVLELLATVPMAGFRPGQVVRADGDLVDPQPHQIKPAFRVRSLQTFGR